MLEAQRALREPILDLLFSEIYCPINVKTRKSYRLTSIAFFNVPISLIFRPITNQVRKDTISSRYLSTDLAVEDEVGVKISTFTVFSH